MFKALYESYLSPLYWILRMLGKDTKDKYRDDIDANMYRLCLKPKTGVEEKKIHKAVRHIYGKIAGVDDKYVNDAMSVYYKLRADLRAADENDEPWHVKEAAEEDLHEFITDNFTIEVDEEERQEILNYLKNNGYMLVVLDEFHEMQNRLQWDREVRKWERFRQEALDHMQADVESVEHRSLGEAEGF